MRIRFVFVGLALAAGRAHSAAQRCRTESDGGRPRRPLGGRSGRRRAVRRSGGGEAGPLYRLRAPGAATARRNRRLHAATIPTGRAQPMLERRRQEALAADPDDAAVLAHAPPAAAVSARRHAALRRGVRPMPADGGRRRWPDGLGHRASTMRPARRASCSAGRRRSTRRRPVGPLPASCLEHRHRRRAAPDHPARPPPTIPRAEARLAPRRDDPQAPAAGRRPAGGRQADPGADARTGALACAGPDRDDEALALWVGAGEAAERQAPPDHLAAFWDERNLLARRRLRDGDAEGAYAIAAGARPDRRRTGLPDAEFLAGFIALRMLNDPARAVPHFRTLAAVSKSAITQARAHYWLARAAAARGDAAAVRAEYASRRGLALRRSMASSPPLALGESRRPGARIAATARPGLDARSAPSPSPATSWPAPPPGWSPGATARGRSLSCCGWTNSSPDPGRPRPGRASRAAGSACRTCAVALARRMGRDGVAAAGCRLAGARRIPADAGSTRRCRSASCARRAASTPAPSAPSGARGLMQLMPPTASAVAQQLGMPASVPALTCDQP